MSYHSGNQLIDPYLLFEKAHLREGMFVADFGCGRTGHIVFPAAAVIGERGVMYAVDILKDTLAGIAKRAELENMRNVHTVWSNVEKYGATAIPAQTLDLIFLVNILFHAADPTRMLAEAKRLLKDKARLAAVDWKRSDLPFGPKEKLVSFDHIKQWGQENNFVVQEEFDMGRYHYGVVLYRHE